MKACSYALAGLKSAFKDEPAFRLEVVLAAILIPLAFWLEVSATARALLIGSVFLVLIAELVNTAIEAAVDRISDEIHPLTKKAKDVGAAIVLLSVVNAALIWSIILFSD